MFSHSNCCLLLLVWGMWITKALFLAPMGDRELLSVLSDLAHRNRACAAAGEARRGSDKVCGWFNGSRAPQPRHSSPWRSLLEHLCARTANSQCSSSQSLSWDPSATNKGQLAALKIYNFFPWEAADMQTYLQSLGLLLLLLYLDAELGF